MLFTQSGQQPNHKGTQHIDTQGDDGKGRLPHRDQPQQIAQHGTHKAAQTYKNYICHFFSCCRVSCCTCRVSASTALRLKGRRKSRNK